MSKDWTKEALQRQAMAAAALLEELADEVDGDEEFAHDVVEGETDFFEAVQKALDEIQDKEVIVVGCGDAIDKLTKRKKQAEGRIARLKGMIDQAFQMAEVKSHQFPTVTISTKRVPPKLIITDESAVPSGFFKIPDPVLDKKALLDAVKQAADAPVEDGQPRKEIPGATLSNGGVTVQFRKA